MKPIYLSATASLLALMLSSPTYAAGDAELGRDKAFTCMGCHGAPGLRNAYPGYRVPKLGGQHADYIALALQAYKDEKRTHPTMHSHAATMSEQDMADIGAYFSTLQQ